VGVDPIANIVFVHGLGGHNKSTWESKPGDASTFWPKWLEEDLNLLPDLSGAPVVVWSLGYPAEVFRFLFFSIARRDSIPERATSLANRIVAEGLANRPLIFVAHSLGGLMVKQMLRRAVDASHVESSELRRLALGTRMVMFLATPHTGAHLARLAEALPSAVRLSAGAAASLVGHLPLRWGLRFVATRAVRRGPFTAALESGDPYLSDLADWYRDNASALDIETVAFYENRPTRGVFVVERTSATQGLTEVTVVPLDADHLSISKPTKRDDHYAQLIGPLRRILPKLPIFRETHLAVLDLKQRFTELRELHPDIRTMAVKRIVHPVEKSLGRTHRLDFRESAASDRPFRVARWQETLAMNSPYDLDRILLSTWRQYQQSTPIDILTQSIRHEAELLPAGPTDVTKVSLMPLFYAAEALDRQLERSPAKLPGKAVEDLRYALKRVEDLARDDRSGIDTNRRTRDLLTKLSSGAS
jgi:hypothetical protein